MVEAQTGLLMAIKAILINIWTNLVVGAAAVCRWIVLSRLPILDDPSFRLIEVTDTYDGQGLGSLSHESSIVECKNSHIAMDEGVVVVKVHSPVFWIRLVFLDDIGFAQSYMLGEVECERLTAFFMLIIKHAGSAGPRTLVHKIGDRMSNLFRKANDIAQASLNANQHYSLSNDIFAAFLDPSMTYSCPIWSKETSNESLENAQLRKLQSTIAKAHIKSTDHVLEIGTGWGSFAILAAQSTGCRVTTLTLSDEQKQFVERRVKQAGLQGQIQVLLCDYREIPVTMTFDKIVSLEMIEHVGAAYLETYFKCMHRHLKPVGGIAVFQCCTIPEVRYDTYRARQDFVQRYIFPGGHLPTVSHLVAAINEGSQGRLIVEDIQNISGHYSRALDLWREAFRSGFEDKVTPALNARYPNMDAADHEIFRRKWLVSSAPLSK